MTQYTFAIRVNDQPSKYLEGTHNAILNQITTHLQEMNGVEKWSLSMWRVPHAPDESDTTPPFTSDYIQCAGSADAMTIEVRVAGGGYDRQ